MRRRRRMGCQRHTGRPGPRTAGRGLLLPVISQIVSNQSNRFRHMMHRIGATRQSQAVSLILTDDSGLRMSAFPTAPRVFARSRGGLASVSDLKTLASMRADCHRYGRVQRRLRSFTPPTSRTMSSMFLAPASSDPLASATGNSRTPFRWCPLPLGDSMARG